VFSRKEKDDIGHETIFFLILTNQSYFFHLILFFG